MAIRSILVIMTGSNEDLGAAETAFLAAGRFAAHVAGLHVRADAIDDLPYIGEGMSQAAISKYFSAAKERQDQAERLAKEQFDLARERAGATYADSPAEGAAVTASWHVEVGSARELVGQRGRVFDLTVLSSHDNAAGASGRDVADGAVFETGRPVLVSPAEPPAALGDRVFVAWNRSAQSARAVVGAMPFLEQVTEITIGYVDTGAKAGPTPEELQASLAWHGIAAEVKRIPRGGGSVAELINAAARDAGADLLVMGAYSHSRLREMVLGGVTHHILGHITLPTMMMH